MPHSIWYTNNLTIVGVNGRPILDASGEIIQTAILEPHGANLVISNLELRHASTQPGQGDNAAGIKIEGGTVNSPAGGNVTIQYCYIHNNQDGILSEDAGPGGPGAPEGDGYPDGQFLYPHPYITLLYDDIAYNDNDSGSTHNIYIGFDNNHQLVFTMKYSWSHDAYVGHVLKTRAPYNNIYYNIIGDALGNSSYIELFGSYVREQTLQSRPFHISAREGAIIVLRCDRMPSFMALARDVSLAGFSLGMQGIEGLL